MIGMCANPTKNPTRLFPPTPAGQDPKIPVNPPGEISTQGYIILFVLAKGIPWRLRQNLFDPW